MMYLVAVYAVITFIFLLWSAFAIYHSVAFGFKGDKTKTVAVAYVIFSLGTLGTQAYLLFTIDWFNLL